tara:strand:- start:231 stop:443 length:213 start_codon:yes stop_codon:yes gene_type:complete
MATVIRETVTPVIDQVTLEQTADISPTNEDEVSIPDKIYSTNGNNVEKITESRRIFYMKLKERFPNRGSF